MKYIPLLILISLIICGTYITCCDIDDDSEFHHYHFNKKLTPTKVADFLDRKVTFLFNEITTTEYPFVPSQPYDNYWMQQAVNFLHEKAGPCPFRAFGVVIVNTTANSPYALCYGYNTASINPTFHGEMNAIGNCSSLYPNRGGINEAKWWNQLTLYVTSVPCGMCSNAIRWAKFKRVVYATTLKTMVDLKWTMGMIQPWEHFERSTFADVSPTTITAGVLASVTDPLFAWQFNPTGSCPSGCSRNSFGGCSP